MSTTATWTLIGIVVLVGVVIGTLFFAQTQLPAPPSAQTLTIAATIFPLTDIARTIGGDFVTVATVIPPGVTEHSDALTPEQLHDLTKARVLFRIGYMLDTNLTDRIARAIRSLRVITVDKGISLHDFDAEPEEHHEEGREEAGEKHHHDTGIDAHYWLTVPNAKTIAATMADVLIEIDPAHAADYRTNLARYHESLDGLERELQAMAAGITRKDFIAMHNAWSYFARHYGLRLVATYEPVEGREPSLADLKRIQDIVKEHGITTFFAEPQKLSTAAVELMQREFGLGVATLDPVGGGVKTASYAELMRFNMRALVEASR